MDSAALDGDCDVCGDDAMIGTTHCETLVRFWSYRIEREKYERVYCSPECLLLDSEAEDDG